MKLSGFCRFLPVFVRNLPVFDRFYLKNSRIMVLFKKLIELTIPNTCDLSTNDFSIHVLKLLNNTDSLAEE